jgi:hypothetical protein
MNPFSYSLLSGQQKFPYFSIQRETQQKPKMQPRILAAFALLLFSVSGTSALPISTLSSPPFISPFELY